VGDQLAPWLQHLGSAAASSRRIRNNECLNTNACRDGQGPGDAALL